MQAQVPNFEFASRRFELLWNVVVQHAASETELEDGS